MKENSSKVSIIIPLYNADDFLEGSFNSALNQSYPNIEIILVNDCSNDNTSEIIKKFQERGGIVTTLSGAEKAKFDKLMKDKVMPAMAKMMDADALLAAQEYAKNN